MTNAAPSAREIAERPSPPLAATTKDWDTLPDGWWFTEETPSVVRTSNGLPAHGVFQKGERSYILAGLPDSWCGYLVVAHNKVFAAQAAKIALLESAILAAEARGERRGLERAAAVCEDYANKSYNSVAANLAYDIRALIVKE